MGSERILRRLRVWIEFEWLRTGAGGELLWVRWWTFRFLRHGVRYLPLVHDDSLHIFPNLLFVNHLSLDALQSELATSLNKTQINTNKSHTNTSDIQNQFPNSRVTATNEHSKQQSLTDPVIHLLCITGSVRLCCFLIMITVTFPKYWHEKYRNWKNSVKYRRVLL
jgi:hypothetical protein